MEPDLWKPAWHIASYPRSGSIIVRAWLEAASGRPTLGQPDRRGLRSAASGTAPQDQAPIGFTAHSLHQILHHRAQAGSPLGFLLITRDPRDAISSHMARRRHLFHRFSATKQRRLVDAEIDSYLALVAFFASEPATTKWHIRFEDLIARNWQTSPTADALARMAGHAGAPQAIPDAARRPSDMKQPAPDRQQLAVKDTVADLVARRLTYDDVMEIIIHNS